DHFKQVNDHFGHGVGDQVLVRTVATWNTVLRQGDRLGRLGGEEFLVVLPGAGIGAGMQVAGRLLEATRAMDLSDLGEGLQLTVSLGVAQVGPGDRTLEGVLERADAALYKAKDNGRD
ncbi:GGDEF domain-containing protein, partial [Lysobacter sp. D1-1-M9]|uniref:GGDEF domain-containing protein n=1 Tax=Novilysobacter longmucuonensis TaxID=3098603 RepID=UPI002FC77AA2